ncbi:MAG: integral rane sensor signal transduction histidine kinase [Bryobacterales bacterium]|nr:integral rane sensor signal transduction histidine kinase [Bryobacterales bacterium]
MDSRRSLTIRLLAGLLVTLTAVAVFSGYSILQLRTLRKLQTQSIDRNRVDSLLLLRIQNSLNSLAIAMRDMLDANEPYPLTAYAPQFARIRMDLEDALAREEKVAPVDRTAGQRRYLAGSLVSFWDALDRIFALARDGQEAEARTRIQLSLQARQAALSTAVAKLLVQNNESEQQAAARTYAIYSGVERNVYLFMAAMLILIVLTSLYLLQYNRRMFDRVAALSERRSELAQQLISMQENTFRSISRELHDDFGQILTAIGVMLQRADRRVSGELQEVREIVQATLDKVRSLSHALHPMVLDEAGLESALDVYLSGFERQTGIAVSYEKTGESRQLDRNLSIHLYRVMQEALNNVARHAESKRASVRLVFLPETIVLEVEDEGVGFCNRKQGMGLVSMRERVELVHGGIEFLDGHAGGVLVRVTAPAVPHETQVTRA